MFDIHIHHAKDPAAIATGAMMMLMKTGMKIHNSISIDISFTISRPALWRTGD